jgi:hypothetical protein
MTSSRVTTGRAFVLAVVPALLLARCGLWPSFPDELLSGDGGADARTDAADARTDGETGVQTDGGPGSDADATVADVPSDVPDPQWNGFRTCGPPPNMMLTPEPAFMAMPNPLAGRSFARDITFDGQGNMLIVGRDSSGFPTLARVTSAGTVRVFYTAMQGLFFGARYLVDGRVVLTGSFQLGGTMNITQGVTILTPAGTVEGRLPSATATPWGSVAHPNGSFVVIDSSDAQLLPFGSGMLPATLPTPVNTAGAMPPAPETMRAAIYSANYRKLFTVAANNNIIHEYNVDEAGVIDGMSRRVYATLPANSFPRSLAFDECGNLYVTLSIAGSPASGALVRIPARGGMPFTLATFDSVDAQRTIAFGDGMRFPATSLYIADSLPGNPPMVPSEIVVRRIDVGIPGQPIVRPSSTMVRDM